MSAFSGVLVGCPTADLRALREAPRNQTAMCLPGGAQGCAGGGRINGSAAPSPPLEPNCVYVGHTPLSEPVVLGNIVYVDTGIVYGHALTMINLAEPNLPIVMHRDPA
jgi:hypothetical protein